MHHIEDDQLNDYKGQTCLLSLRFQFPYFSWSTLDNLQSWSGTRAWTQFEWYSLHALKLGKLHTAVQKLVLSEQQALD